MRGAILGLGVVACLALVGCSDDEPVGVTSRVFAEDACSLVGGDVVASAGLVEVSSSVANERLTSGAECEMTASDGSAVTVRWEAYGGGSEASAQGAADEAQVAACGNVSSYGEGYAAVGDGCSTTGREAGQETSIVVEGLSEGYGFVRVQVTAPEGQAGGTAAVAEEIAASAR